MFKNLKLKEHEVQMKIEDFGEKIGGARKELWHNRGLNTEDILSMNDREMYNNVKKSNVWKKPDYEELLRQGHSIRKLFFMKKVRDSIPTKPVINYSQNLTKQCQEYIETVHRLEQDCMEISSDEDILNFYKDKIINRYVIPLSDKSRFVDIDEKVRTAFTSNVLKTVQVFRLGSLDMEIRKKQFCYSENEKLLSKYSFVEYNPTYCNIENTDNGKVQVEVSSQFGKLYFYVNGDMTNKNHWEQNTFFVAQAHRIIANNFNSKEDAEVYILALEKTVQAGKKTEKSKRKGRYIPKQLEHIERKGMNYRRGRQITGNDYLKEFDFKGGEFGNYMGENDRQQSLNFGYDALLDLSRALHINPKDISLDKQLSIAFGARGKGIALAHYEPDRTVINLTKMRGAGNLAHEWGHALDDFIGRKLKLPLNTFASDYVTSQRVIKEIPALHKLIQTIKYGENFRTKKENTIFFRNAVEMDRLYSKSDHGYWASNVELFARAFACYVHDKLGEDKSDYLCGHAYSSNPQSYPPKEEMQVISQHFDELFKELKELNLLHDYDFPLEKTQEHTQVSNPDFVPYENENGQFSLFDLENEKELDY